MLIEGRCCAGGRNQNPVKASYSERVLLKRNLATVRLLALVVFAALGACSKDTPSLENPSDAAQSGELTFTAEQIRALGIATTPARATDYQSHIDGFGMVISLETFAQ